MRGAPVVACEFASPRCEIALPAGIVWSSEDAQRASTPTTDRESRCTSDTIRGRRPLGPQRIKVDST
eukprot:1195321-Prorocentrum_minimum.AAC.5